MNLRKFLQKFFDRYQVPWEIFMIALAIIFVVIGFLPDLLDFSSDTLDLLDSVDLGITLFFGLEFVTRISVASSRKAYLKDHWVDLIAILPVVRWLRIVRMARVVRLLNLIRLVRVLNSLERLGLNVTRFARLNGLQWMILALTIVMLIASASLFLFEHMVNDKITNYWDALYASLVTWTTPGYGDIVPVTTNGRICGLILIVSGLIAWGMFIANLAAFLAGRRIENGLPPAMRELELKLSQIDQLSKEELVCLRGAITALIDDRIKR